MPNNPMKELKTPAAKRLAEAFLIQADILSSIATVQVWHKKYANPSSEEEKTVGLSLFRDAVVQFIACFEDGKLGLNRDDIYREQDGGNTYFKWLKDVRDAYAAHRFGANRQCVVGTFRDPATGVLAIGNLLAIYAGPTEAAGPQLIAFMRVAASHVERLIQHLVGEVLNSVNAMTQEEIDALNSAKIYGVDQSEVRTSRNNIQRVKSGIPPRTR